MGRPLRTTLKGITIENHPFDRGYWDRFNGAARPTRKSETREGWDTCDAELADERRVSASAAANKRWHRERVW